MTGTQLRCFLAAAKYLNFTTAAAALYLTQPTLSKNIAALEQELGLALFYRARRGLRLTPGGKRRNRIAQPLGHLQRLHPDRPGRAEDHQPFPVRRHRHGIHILSAHPFSISVRAV